MKIIAWIASITLGALAVFFLATNYFAQSVSVEKMPLVIHAVGACVFASAVLLFPPLWRGDKAAKWKWPRIIAAIILAAVGLLAPVQTHAVKLTMPAPSQSR